jgi:hypothetical protein
VRRLAALVVALALLATATATAATPGKYKGRTGQHRKVKVTVNDSGRVIFTSIRWRAHCKSGQFWTASTPFTDTASGPIEQTPTGFTDSGTYTQPSGGGYKGITTVSIAGTFDSDTKVHGTFKAKVKVRRHGQEVTRCKMSTKWTAKRA